MPLIRNRNELKEDEDWDSIIIVSSTILGLNPGLEFAISPGRKNASALDDHKIVTAINKNIPELETVQSHHLYAFDITIGGPLSRIYGIAIDETATFAMDGNYIR